MKIKDLPQQLQELAIQRCMNNRPFLTTKEEVLNTTLDSAFEWKNTPEGSEFWINANRYHGSDNAKDFIQRLADSLNVKIKIL